MPAWYAKARTPETTALAATLSLWTDPRSARDAVYSGLHREALTRRHDWFERSPHPRRSGSLWAAPAGSEHPGCARVLRSRSA
ncbi:hypothetical protein STENM223S_05495 [Streptomyces tendae]